VLILSKSNLLHFESRGPSSSGLRLLKEFEKKSKIVVLVERVPQTFKSRTTGLFRVFQLHGPRRAHNQRLADFLVFLPAFLLTILGAVDNVSAYFAAGEGNACRLYSVAVEALHKHD
jgi:hypothetical protein